MKDNISELFNDEILLNSIFCLEITSIWSLIKNDLQTLLERHLDDSITDIMYTFENFKNTK